MLVGTFNKILGYPSGIYADQHFHFQGALRNTDHVLVAGYGFRDKAINSRIIAWAERPGRRRMVVIHRDPESFESDARGAVRNLWRKWQHSGLLCFVPKFLGDDGLDWQQIKDALTRDAREAAHPSGATRP